MTKQNGRGESNNNMYVRINTVRRITVSVAVDIPFFLKTSATTTAREGDNHAAYIHGLVFRAVSCVVTFLESSKFPSSSINDTYNSDLDFIHDISQKSLNRTLAVP